jgi:hypothetical protein
MEIERIAHKWVKRKWGKYTGRTHRQRHAKGKWHTVHDGFDIRLMVMVFDVVCAITKTVSYENAYLTVDILRKYKGES